MVMCSVQSPSSFICSTPAMRPSTRRSVENLLKKFMPARNTVDDRVRARARGYI